MLLGTQVCKNIQPSHHPLFSHSNVTAGTHAQIQSVLDAGLLPILVNVLTSAPNEVKKEAAWALTNLSEGGTQHQIDAAVTAGCIHPMVALLKETKDPKVLVVMMEGLENIFRVGDEIVKVCCNQRGVGPQQF